MQFGIVSAASAIVSFFAFFHPHLAGYLTRSSAYAAVH
jgi:hypothetical protein